MHVNDKIQEIKDVFLGISKDINEILTTVQLSVPVVEEVANRVKRRVRQVQQLIGSEGDNGSDA